ncbi:dipeptide ABC transporter ATP-binding protein [Paenibacillus filicis]|uniref:Dipeptide ABC transporter ATP-binding protein n=1 Tax=Paenibacillus gyeongsangnamensis TaxID=3388067 RepID=A0ABT4QKD6_9BACL|nr:dipeptide ABC transporter ATP-binding protein [Paenibacillus filicis]MCZ8517339.1 dipeptide ABC transporter ATP-binding protein [Paenibacillus filicis]
MTTRPLLEVQDLQKVFTVGTMLNRKKIHAIRNVSFSIQEGETFALVGESGCGKSTTGRAIIRLTKPTSGTVKFNSVDLGNASNRDIRTMRRDIQMVFQDPYASLNPRMTIGRILAEPYRLHNLYSQKEREEKVIHLMEEVGLRSAYRNRFPHEFSGGQRQRIGIARALALHPKLIIADEPVSALDVSVQAQVLNLLMDLQEKYKLSYLFISHDLSVVKHISHRIGVMYLGEIVEVGEKEDIYSNPLHPYTQSLLSCIPTINKKEKSERIILSGDVPNPASPPSGCAFHPRCSSCMEICKSEKPKPRQIDKQVVACHLYN